MAKSKKLNLDEIEVIENNSVAELTGNDNIVEYIQPSSLELLKARYAAVEEDESIRNEGFDLAKRGGLIKKARPESTAFDYFSAPVSPKEEIRTDVDSPLSQVFDSTKSEFDADIASFSDITIASPEPVAEPENTEETPAPAKKRTTRTKKVAEDAVQETVEEAPAAPKKRNTRTKKVADDTVIETVEEAPATPKKRTTKTKKVTDDAVPEAVEEAPAAPKKRNTRSKKVADDAVIETVEEAPATPKKRATRTKRVAEEVTVGTAPAEDKTELKEQIQEITVDLPAPTINNRYGFNTNTRVIYVDESADDGIQRNSDDELSSAFITGETRKRRFSFWSRKKK